MGYSWYKENVRRTDCMKATGDDWCSACSGTTCTACYPRGTFSGAASDPILLDARTGKARDWGVVGMLVPAVRHSCAARSSACRCHPVFGCVRLCCHPVAGEW